MVPQLIYDGSCGFCRIWIAYWKELAGGRVEFVRSAVAWPSWVRLVFSDGREAGGVHRNIFYRLTAILFGRGIDPGSYRRVEWLFLRLLALSYLAAFVSLGIQVRGLIGSHGILPLGEYLASAAQSVGAWEARRMLPGLFWMAHGDGVLVGSCVAGSAVAVVLLLGFLERWCLGVLFVLYLSFCSAGQDFLSFQWDMLLLEAGFLAIFLGSSNGVVWLYRVLVFRLMFSSGVVKLLSGDPNWRSLRAMEFHYFTQPLPTPVAWYMQQLPPWFQRYSTVGLFAIELAAPFLIFLPRRPRMFGAAGLILLQVLIMTTGNYAFFNWLSIALCLFLFDDAAMPAWIPQRAIRITPRRVAVAVSVVVLGLGLFQMMATFGMMLPQPAAWVVRLTAPFGIVNSYGLFAVMTTTRMEITVQGSYDGVTWSDYEFKYKPGRLDRWPRWVAPHQPRLDWQMWFAALSTYRNNPWFVSFLVRLLEGSTDVEALLKTNPSAKSPPRYVRAVTSMYRFTDWEERRKTGNIWKVESGGVYVPAISLADVRQ